LTVGGNRRKGERPSFIRAVPPALSQPLYEAFCAAMETETGRPVSRGVFAADMKISLVNDGPVTIVIDKRSRE
jgi:D-tyrosyl-tRNA(Tyr) deacylase